MMLEVLYALFASVVMGIVGFLIMAVVLFVIGYQHIKNK